MSWRATLGVQAGASHEEIRAAFKRRVLETHPDKGGKASEFRQVMLAFERATADSVGADVLKARGARWVRRAPKPRAKARPATTRPPQGRRRCPKNTAIMQKLHGYLKQLQRDDRRVTIATTLQQHHRLALEAWIQAQTMRGWHHEDAWPRQVASEEGDKREGSDTDESLEDLQPLALEDITPADAKVGRTMRPGPHKGIIRRPGRVRLYSVIVVISNIELFAASTTDLAAAVDVHMALTSLKQRISKRPELVRRLGEELELAMNDYDLSMEEARISLRVHFPVHHWTGSGLRSPTFPMAQLGTVLEVWRKLQEARLPYSGVSAKRGGIFFQHSPQTVERAWERITSIFAEIWVNAGCEEAHLRERLEAQRRRHEAQRGCQLAAWNRHRMAAEERRQQLCERLLRRREERERRRMGWEDRRAVQVASLTAKVVQRIERLLLRWDRADARRRKAKQARGQRRQSRSNRKRPS
ncbi:unnamed protein product [Effrenium voratum]|uniref:J domain-containing protein n=1 Tax=Effrenium voratum TaxID=2562239 RepID=A0AA36I9P1_9DINO|nr:unnamed protein product [Effrenium voratum]CAJ1424101.1 unnamed protein product [Effrenium voratum]